MATAPPLAPGPVDLAQIESAIYDESFRALEEQAKVLDAMRERGATLVTVANVATAFLGGLVVLRLDSGRGGELGFYEWAAIGLFGAALLTSVVILMPSQNWIFWHDAQAMLAVYVDPGPPATLSEFRREVAYHNGTYYESNGVRIERLGEMLWFATFCIAVEIVFWLLSISTST